MRRLRALFSIGAMACIGGCLFGTETTNPRGSEVEGLHGRLVDAAGKPVAQVRVTAVASGNIPLGAGAAPGDSVLTGKSGEYQFSALGAGQFNLLGDFGNGNLVVLIPDVKYAGGNAKVDLGTDTLRAPGRIEGGTRLEGQGIAGIFCYLPGTSLISISDGTGAFRITGVPKGSYEVKYSYPGLRTATDSGVIVRPGEITFLPPKELGYDTAYPPPPPGRLGIAYDTVAGAVVLNWNRPRVEDLDGFVVYRIDSATSTPIRINAGLVRDTVYRDTVFNNPDALGRRNVTYRIKSQDSGQNLSSVYSPAAGITAVAPGSVRTRFTFRWSGPEGKDITIGDSARIIAAWSNPTFRHRGFSWYLEGRDEAVRRVVGDFPATGEDTLVWSWRDSTVVRLRINADTEAGLAWEGDTLIPVRLAAPTAIAGTEAVIEAGKSALFTGRGVDPVGRIVEYAWDFDGDGVFEKVSEQDGNVQKVFAAGQHRAVFRVTDDDGNRDADTLDFLVGHGFDGDIIEHDVTFTAEKGPYFFARKVLIPEGVKVTVDPGTVLRFGEEGFLQVQGSLYCVGTAKDSIRIVVDVVKGKGGEAKHSVLIFLDGSGSRLVDTAYQSGSLLRFVSFRGMRGVEMTNSLVSMEDCSFKREIGGGDFGEWYGVSVSLGEPVNGAWLFRRNRLSLVVVRTGFDAPARMDAYFQGNTISNEGLSASEAGGWWATGLWVEHQKRQPAGTFLIERNVFRMDSTADGGNGNGILAEAHGADPGYKFIVRENLFRTVYVGVNITGLLPGEIAKNDFLNCYQVLAISQASPEDAIAKPTRALGRFHHNRINRGHFYLPVETGGLRADSNHFDIPVRIDSDTSRGFDFRNNYWSTLDTKAIANRLVDSEGRPKSGIADFTPILTASPPGAGRTKP